MSVDKLEEMFDLREEYMKLLCQRFDGIYPSWPLDVSKKQSQTLLRDVTLKGVEEMFEALGELKNHKAHRVTEIPDFNSDAFLEEMVDAMNYFFTVMILVGVNPSDFLEAYRKKHRKIVNRLNDGY